MREGRGLAMRHGGDEVTVASGIGNDVWTHIAAVFNENADSSEQGVLYIDGERVASGAMDAPSETGNLHLGDSPIQGLFDDVRYYHRALSDEEIRALYRDTRA